MAGTCDDANCDMASPGRRLCDKHYGRDLRARRAAEVAAARVRRPDRSREETWRQHDQPAKVDYLRTLTLGETAAYCVGVLSRASIVGTEKELRSWQRLIREIALAGV